MSKKKKKIKRQLDKVPTEYLAALADRIHGMNPTKKIIENTLSDVYVTAHGRGYQRRIDDTRFFKEKQSKHIKTEWNKIRDHYDDLIHKSLTKTINNACKTRWRTP